MPFDIVAASVGATTMGILGFWTNLGYHYWRGARRTQVLNSEHPLTERCTVEYQAARRECGCTDTEDEAATTSEAAEIFLVYFRTRNDPSESISEESSFPFRSGTSHWAIEVRGSYFELCRNRDIPTDTGYNLIRRPAGSVRSIFRAALGATHFSNEEIYEVGERYAEAYVYDRFFRNCQVFLWEAYLGRRYMPTHKQEIRCPQQPRLELPVFTGAIMSSVFGGTYVVSSLLNMLLMPATLTVPTFWISLVLQCSPLFVGMYVLWGLVGARWRYMRRVGSCEDRQLEAPRILQRVAARLRGWWEGMTMPIRRMLW